MDMYLKRRIEHITEADFWSSMRVSGGVKDAIAAGKAGRKAQAYRLLGEYHAKTLADEAADFAGQDAREARDKAAAKVIRERADRTMRHEIAGWHTHVKQFGKVIDFNADFGVSGQYGFHYLGWLMPVLQEYVRGGGAKYRNGFLEIIKQYYGQRAKITRRIPALHPVYYELGAWAKTGLMLPAYATLMGDGALDVKSREAMLKLLLGFARSLYRIAEPGYQAGNWQIVGCAGLYWIGAAFPEFKEAAAWRRRGAARIALHAERDFFADGGHGERCWSYGGMSLGGVETFYRAAVRHGRLTAERQKYWERFFVRCWRWRAASTGPGYSTLAYGDGGIGPSREELDAAAERFKGLARKPGEFGVDRTRSNILKPSGYAFMRCGDGEGDPFMSINFGQTGGWHTHDDLLDFSLWRWGRPLLEEVGRFNSYDNPLEPMFRSARSHNQVVIEHRKMDRAGHEGHDVKWAVTEGVDFFSAWHEGFAPARVHRQIAFVKPGYWVVYDVVTDDHCLFQATSYLHGLRPFRKAGAGRWRLEGSPSCLVAMAEPGEIGRVETGVDYSAADLGDLRGRGAAHGWRDERHRLGVSKWKGVGVQTPITFAMLLVPFEGKAPRATIERVTVRGDETGRAGAFAVKVGGRRDVVVFNPGGGAVRAERKRVSGVMAARVKGKWAGV